MRRLIVHIGAPKCGSTYLQRVLLRHRYDLRDHAISYPHRGVGHPGNGEMIYEITEPWLRRSFDTADVVVLSHELLFAAAGRAGRLRTLSKRIEFDVDIIAFLRPFDEIVLGDYSQHIKQYLPEFAATGRAFHGRSFRQFVWARQKDIQPAGFLTAWQRALPDARLTIGHHTQIKDLFCQLIPTLSQIDWSLPVWRSNPSLSRHQGRAMLDAALQSGRTPTLSLPRTPQPDTAMRNWIRAVFEPQRRAMIDAFGFDPHGAPQAQTRHVA